MAAGVVGSRFLPGAWYASLAKPSWNPPAYLFGPVWTVLYTSMGVAAWLVWRKLGYGGARPVLVLFLVHLGFNALWSYLFFGLQQPGWAFAEIILLWLMILALTVGFWRISAPAGVLLVPYLGWVSFASVLNFTLWRMNLGQG